MKSYTDLEQSKRLIGILPLESADMCYSYYHNPISGASYYEEYPIFHIPINKNKSLPCWSLTALLKIIKYYDIEADDGIIIKRKLCYEPYQITTQKHNDIINACIEMILKLKEIDLI